jgi:type II secretory pathway component PulF
MPVFKYRAVDNNGKGISGVLPAENEQALQTHLKQMRLYLISAKETKPQKEFRFGGRVKRRELITFTVHLQTIISAGVPIIQG